MIRTSFNDSWEVRPKVNPFAELMGASVPFRPMTLPHDAMIEQDRAAPDGGDGAMEAASRAHFPGGAFEHRKTFSVPAGHRGKRIHLEFEGVYRDATVYVHGDYAGQRPYGYSLFRIDAGRFLRFGEDDEVHVEARTHRDSRWYTGAGIYRDTWMLVGGAVRIAPDGLRVTASDIDRDRAAVEVAATVENDSVEIRTLDLAAEIRDAAGAVAAADTAKVTVLPGEPATLRRRLYVPEPSLWGPESPPCATSRRWSPRA
ncbi:sugar-binding domain-containing protein [Spirillospora sp. NPDC000708]